MYFLIFLLQVQPRQSLSEQQNGKDLSIGVFKYGDKAKVYFATNSKNFHSLTDVSIINVLIAKTNCMKLNYFAQAPCTFRECNLDSILLLRIYLVNVELN